MANSMMILVKILLILMIKDNLSNGVEGVQVLMDKYNDYRQESRQLFEEQMGSLSRMKDKLVQYFKSYFMVEPTERETKLTDEALNVAFSFGSSKQIDCLNKLKSFCESRKEHREIISSWVIRKYTFNLMVRMFVNLFLKRMERKNEIYCANEANREYFVNITEELLPIKPKLNAIRDEFIDQLVSIQNSNVGIGKAGTLCCSFWKWRNDTLNAVATNSCEKRTFISDMIDTYFGLSIKYVCFYHSEKSKACSQSTRAPKVPHVHDSLGLNLIRAVAKVSNIVL